MATTTPRVSSCLCTTLLSFSSFRRLRMGPKALFAKKILHYQHVSDRNGLTARSKKCSSSKKESSCYSFPRSQWSNASSKIINFVLQEKYGKRKFYNVQLQLDLIPLRLPPSHMWIPNALSIFINLLIQKIIKGNMVVGKRCETLVFSFKMIYLFAKFNVRYSKSFP